MTKFKEWFYYFWRGSISVYIAPPRRIPLVELYRRATGYGFDFLGRRLDILWFNERLREAAQRGEIALWGRPVLAAVQHCWVLDVQRPIPGSHWRGHELDWIAYTNFRDSTPEGFILSLSKENVLYSTYALVTRKKNLGFFDLHIYDAHASSWLRNVPPCPVESR